MPSWPSKIETNCRAYGCLGTIAAGQIYTTCRLITSVVNIINGICLYKLVQSKVTNKAISYRSTSLVLRTILMSLIFDSLPHLSSFLLYSIFNINITVYLGPYSLICSVIESFSCSLIYRRAFCKTSDKSSQINPSRTKVRSITPIR
uniref:Vomeronasal type-1 receptor n=1 Tax=Panagrolaimus sp. JU765 TaxID=591449 RepID=A0AC34QAQ0_9BILA